MVALPAAPPARRGGEHLPRGIIVTASTLARRLTAPWACQSDHRPGCACEQAAGGRGDPRAAASRQQPNGNPATRGCRPG
jgi:hypothetical protein